MRKIVRFVVPNKENLSQKVRYWVECYNRIGWDVEIVDGKNVTGLAGMPSKIEPLLHLFDEEEFLQATSLRGRDEKD